MVSAAQSEHPELEAGAFDVSNSTSNGSTQYGVTVKLDSPALNNDRLPGSRKHVPVKPRGRNTAIETDTSVPSNSTRDPGHDSLQGAPTDSSCTISSRSSGHASNPSDDEDLLTSIPPQTRNDIEAPLLTPLPTTSTFPPQTSTNPYLHYFLNSLPVKRLVWAFEPPPPALRGTHFRLALFETFLLGLLFGLIAGPIAYYFEVIKMWKISFAPLLLLKAFFLPALLEETIFRVLLNPHPQERSSVASEQIWALISLALYVAWHPFNAWLLTPSTRHVFYGPSFLVVTVLLGSACLAAYKRRGSVWQAVLLHWAAVCVWLTLGGRADLGY